jgi:heat shock protein HtpX
VDPLTDAARANARRTTVVLLAVVAAVGLAAAALLAVVGVVAAAGSPLLAVIVGPVLGGLAIGGLVARWIWSGAEKRVLQVLGARAVSASEEPGLHNLAEGLCASAGLPKPSLYVVDDDALNALAVGRDARRAAIVVTSGLLASLERIELEGVLAQELAHVKALDSRVGSVAAAFAPLGPRAVVAVMGFEREEAADAASIAFTRYPPGLLRALEKLAAGPTAVRSGAKVTSHLWFAPAPTVGVSLIHRIDALRELS